MEIIFKYILAIRTHWYFQKPGPEPVAFSAMAKLEKTGHRSAKMVSWKTDVTVSKSQLVEDCNNLRLFHNAERTADKSWGALPFLLFTMSSPARF
jgi:hypothetical protein